MKVLLSIRCPFPDLRRGGRCEGGIVRGVLGGVRILVRERVGRESMLMGCQSLRGIREVGVGSGHRRFYHEYYQATIQMIVPGATGILRTHFTNFLTLASLCVTAWPPSCLSRSRNSLPCPFRLSPLCPHLTAPPSFSCRHCLPIPVL